jgi:hypothetical protein
MKFREFKVLSEQSAPNSVNIIVYFEDGTTQAVDEIPLSVFNSPEFRTQLEDKLLRKYDKIVVRYARVGDDTIQGNPDGNTSDTKTPTVLTSPEGEDEIEQAPDEVKDIASDPVTGTRTISSAEAAEQYNSYADSVDKDRDNKHDETGEPVLRMNDEGKFVDAEGNILDIPANSVNLPSFDPSKFEPSDSGGSGGGGMTGEQEAEVPSIIEDLFNAMDGLGTNEGGLIAALRRVITPDHFIEVRKQYQNEYGDKLGERIKSEFQIESATFAPNLQQQLNELNTEMRRLGWQLVRPKGIRIFNGLIWKKYSAPESE